MSSAFSMWLLNMHVLNESTCSDLHRCTMKLSSCMLFMTKDFSIDAIKSQYFFTSFHSAIDKLSIGESLFLSDDDNVRALDKNSKESWLPLLSSTQLVESKAKDVNLRGSTGRDESNVSKISMMCSLIIPEITTTIKENEEH